MNKPFKVGDIIEGLPGNCYSFTCGGSRCRVVELLIGGVDDIRVEVISSPGGGVGQYFPVMSSRFALVKSHSGKDKKNQPTTTVKGHEPKLVIKVGCKEINPKDARKIAARMLSVVRASKDVPSIKSSYDGETLTEQDVLNFQKWLKEQKL